MASGGKREGAGRKGFCDEAVTICWRISKQSRCWIVQKAQMQSVPAGKIIDDLVKAYRESE